MNDSYCYLTDSISHRQDMRSVAVYTFKAQLVNCLNCIGTVECSSGDRIPLTPWPVLH